MRFEYKKVRVGADPELFLKQGDKYISSIGLVGGSKDKPKKIDKLGHAVQEDNVAVEYNIKPAVTVEEFLDSHKFVLGYLAKALPEYRLDFSASVEFTPDQLENPKAQQFGCDPDYNAWTMTVNEPPRAARINLRTAGGHIHIGYHKPEIRNQVGLIRAMDLFVGVPSIILDPDKRRRQMYGKAGAFRPKEYGAEYRTVSNFWIKSEDMIRWAYHNTQAAVAFLNKGNVITDEVGRKIQLAINKGDEGLSRELCKEFAVAGV